MRLELGLDLPERRIGLVRPRFRADARRPRGVLTHAAKLAGAPTVPSRFSQRLAAVAGDALARRARARRAIISTWARELDRPRQSRRSRSRRRHRRARRGRQASPSPRSSTGCATPTPSTPSTSSACAARCRRYAARRRRPRHRDPRRDRRFHADLRRGPARRSARALIETRRRQHFAALKDYPEARAFWWPRFMRIARWFARWEIEAARQTWPHSLPKSRRNRHPARRGAFTLRARADRIERARGRPLRHPRLQDRLGADRETGAHRPRAAAHARSRDAA